MEPIGLTLKRRNKKYARAAGGELMLVHRCTGCGGLSINRIAADDLEAEVLEVFGKAEALPGEILAQIQGSGIDLLGAGDRETVTRQLFGSSLRF
jgi:hypothetical protein